MATTMTDPVDSLVKRDYAMLIDGEVCAAADGVTLEVSNPSTGRDISRVPYAGAADVQRAVEAARRAFRACDRRLAKYKDRIRVELPGGRNRGSRRTAKGRADRWRSLELFRESPHRHVIRLRDEADIEAWTTTPFMSDERAFSDIADWGPSQDWSD